MTEWIHSLVEWTLNIAHTPYADVGLFAIAFIESSFFPVPPDLLLIALGALRPERAFIYAGLALVGSVLGAVLGYGIGKYGGRPLLDRFLSEAKISAVQKLFHKYDVWAIGIAGFTPIPYKVFAISGGVFHINFKRFILVSILSRGSRFFIVGTCFYFFGESIRETVMKNLNLFSVLFVVVLVAGFASMTFFAPSSKKEIPAVTKTVE